MTNLSKSRTQEILKLHEGIVSSMRRSVADAIRIGELLTEAKADLDHGMFIPWIERELPFSERTARSYMLVFDHRDKTATVADLQSAYRIVERLETEAAQKERERKDRLIAEKQATGQKPEGWDRSVAREEKLRQEDAQFHERLDEAQREREEQTQEPTGDNGRTAPAGRFEEVIAAILKEEPKHVDLELADMRANVKQGKVFSVLREYIDSFDGVSRQLEATYNLMRYLRRVAIELQPKTQVIA
jgi:predicted HAD superfamily Cof-like phosphohydrolase